MRLPAIFALTLVTACGAPPNSITPPAVETGEHTDLAALLKRPHAYALGPLEGSGGELLVWDGVPFVGRVEDGSIRVGVDRAATVSWLVGSHVKEWRQVAVPNEIRTLDEFERWLPAAGLARHLDPARPFAFLLLGACESATLQVSDAPTGTSTLGHCAIQVLGFFSPEGAGGKGDWLPSGHRAHLHLRTLLGGTLGHLETFVLSPGASLAVPWR